MSERSSPGAGRTRCSRLLRAGRAMLRAAGRKVRAAPARPMPSMPRCECAEHRIDGTSMPGMTMPGMTMPEPRRPAMSPEMHALPPAATRAPRQPAARASGSRRADARPG